MNANYNKLSHSISPSRNVDWIAVVVAEMEALTSIWTSSAKPPVVLIMNAYAKSPYQTE